MNLLLLRVLPVVFVLFAIGKDVKFVGLPLHLLQRLL